MVTALAALAGGCSRVVIADLVAAKLQLAASLGPIVPLRVDQGLVQATWQGALRELGKGAGVRSPRWAARGDSATRTGAGPTAASEPLAPPAVGG